MAIPAQQPRRALKAVLALIVIGGLLMVSLFLGLMIATAGGAIHPPLSRVAAPFACDGKFVIQSRRYSYKPGQTGVQHQIYCEQPTGAREEITLRAVFIASLVYSALAFAVGLVIAVPLLWWLNRNAARLRGSLTQAASRLRDGVDRGMRSATTTRPVVDGRDYGNTNAGGAQTRPASSGSDVADRLRQLQQLHDAGLITSQDYEAKKADILSRL